MKRLKSARGMTMVEIIIALAILGIVSAGIIGFFTDSFKFQARSQNLVVVQKEAEEIMEELKNNGGKYDAIIISGEGSGSISDQEIGDYKVDVSWEKPEKFSIVQADESVGTGITSYMYPVTVTVTDKENGSITATLTSTVKVIDSNGENVIALIYAKNTVDNVLRMPVSQYQLLNEGEHEVKFVVASGDGIIRTGYEFEGWSNENGDSVEPNSTIFVDDTTTLYAQWIKLGCKCNGCSNDVDEGEQYCQTCEDNMCSWCGKCSIHEHVAHTVKVSLDANGGKLTSESGQKVGKLDVEVKYGETYNNLPEAEREGYAFDGWYTSKTGIERIDENVKVTIIAKNGDKQDLYAHWTANEYDITFDANGGTLPETSKKVTYDSTYGDLPTPTKAGCYFDGWYTQKNGGTQITEDTQVKITDAQTLYAHWGLVKLAKGSTWYKGKDASEIKEIEIVDTYTGAEKEGWNAAAENAGEIKCYEEGSKLTIVGTTGKIYANEDSSCMFGYYKDNTKKKIGNDFENLEKITGLDKLDTTKVENMKYMFSGCSNLKDLDVSGFNTTKVTDMGFMFYECNELTSLNVSNFNTASVRTMNSMFYGCSELTSLDVSNFDTTNVDNMVFMFYDCSELTSLKLDTDKFNTAKVTNMAFMFADCNALTSLDVSKFNTEKVETMQLMFLNCKSLGSLDLRSFNTSKVWNMNQLFDGCESLKTLMLGDNFVTDNVIRTAFMFRSCKKLESLDVSKFNTEKVESMTGMFAGCASLTSLDLSNFNTVNVTDMYNMFGGCISLTSLDLSNFNTRKVVIGYSDKGFVSQGMKAMFGSGSDENAGKITGNLNTITLGPDFIFSGKDCTGDAAAKLPVGKWYKEGTTEYWDNGQPEEGKEGEVVTTREVVTTYIKK